MLIKLMELLSTSGGKLEDSFGSLVTRHSYHQFTTINVNTFLQAQNIHDPQDLSGLLSPQVYDY